MFRLALHWQILIGMVVGGAIGIGLNVFASTSRTVITEGLPADLDRLEITDSTDGTRFRLLASDQTSRTLVVGHADGAADGVKVFASLQEFRATEPALAALYESQAMSQAHRWGDRFKRLGGLLLRLLKMSQLNCYCFFN